VLALSPFADPFIVHKTLPTIVMPVMYQGGTKDWGVTPSLKQQGGGGYDQTPAPKYFMNIDGGRHMSFSDRGQNAAEYKLITTYALAFFDRHVRGVPAPLLDQAKPLAGVAEFRAQVQ
jgi:predicted dienelactone hydrolase